MEIKLPNFLILNVRHKKVINIKKIVVNYFPIIFRCRKIKIKPYQRQS